MNWKLGDPEPLRSPIAGECEFQVNMVCYNRSPLGRVESLRPANAKSICGASGRRPTHATAAWTGKQDDCRSRGQIVNLLAESPRRRICLLRNVDLRHTV